jgi:triphosphoribosyl-dephospho-CoA synthase
MMTARRMTPAEQAQIAMMLEVTAYPKPGNVDRCHDYLSTSLEHFLASIILSRPSFERASEPGATVGSVILDAVTRTNVHSGGNTHFGAFLLLIPLIMGGDISGAVKVTQQTTVDDAVDFYKAFGMTQVRILPSDSLDVNDPSAFETIRQQKMTLYDIMAHSAQNDMIAREWINGFEKVRQGADLLKINGRGRNSIVQTFLELLADEPDTFIVKKHGLEVAERTMKGAREVLEGSRDLVVFDRACIDAGINPGSTADIIIGSLYVALGEGWEWDF